MVNTRILVIIIFLVIFVFSLSDASPAEINDDILNKMIATEGLDIDLTVTKIPLSIIQPCIGAGGKSGSKFETKWEFVTDDVLVYRKKTIDLITNNVDEIILAFEILPDKAIFSRLIINGKEFDTLGKAVFVTNVLGPCALALNSNNNSNNDNDSDDDSDDDNDIDSDDDGDKNINLDQVNSYFDDCNVFIELKFPGYTPEDYIGLASKLYKNDNNNSSIYNIKDDDKVPYQGHYIQLIKNNKFRGFLVRKHNNGLTVRNDFIVNGILLKFTEDDLHGNSCSDPVIFKNGKTQDLTDALENNELFLEVVKIRDGIDWENSG
ncbi:MAG: hypothetical protein LBS60_08020 [Deltaproteobacteria bacterium]|jgi:hypothetical protein|nr:hypothetical protein [Deltaproteobacteria bacterium]